MPDSGALFAAWQPRLVAYFRRAVGDQETARDLAQEVFLRASRARLPATDGERRAWLFRVARNLALDHHRRCRRHPESPELPEQAVRAASQDVDLAVAEALAALPDVDRDVFLMREVAGLGYEEIAAACDLTPDAVRSRLHRTRLHLREQLARPIAAWRTTASRRTGVRFLYEELPFRDREYRRIRGAERSVGVARGNYSGQSSGPGRQRTRELGAHSGQRMERQEVGASRLRGDVEARRSSLG